METLFVKVGGHARQNNGDAGIGICYYTSLHSEPFYEEAEYVGVETQNSAVYRAIIKALTRAVDWQFKRIKIYSDNRLVVGQLSDNMSVRAQNIVPLHMNVKLMADAFDEFSINLKSSKDNERAKELAKSAAVSSPERITAQAIQFDVGPGITGLVLAFTPKMMIVRFTYKKGSKIGLHRHVHEQGSYLVRGALKYQLAGQDIIVRKGAGLVVSSNSEHQIEALEDSTEIVTYSLMRWDLLNIS